MLDLIGAGISIVSGIFGQKSADKDKKAAQRQANNEKKAAKKISSAQVKSIDKQIDLLEQSYNKSKTSISDAKKLAKQSLATQLSGELSAINLQYVGAQKAYDLQLQSFGIDRQAQNLLTESFKEQERQDRIQVQLEGNEIERQLNENIRAAETEKAYKKVAARRALGKADQDATDYQREGSAITATAKTVQAASGFTTEGSPMHVDQAMQTEIMIGTSRILQGGDEEFMKYMQDVNELNQFVHTQKESKDVNKIVTVINKKGISSRTGLQVKGSGIALKSVDIQEKAAKEDLDFSNKIKNLSALTATQLAEAQKKGISLSAEQETQTLKMARATQRESLYSAKTQAKIGAQVSVNSANSTLASRTNAANASGMGSMISGVTGALNNIQQGKTFSSLTAKGNGGFKLFGN